MKIPSLDQFCCEHKVDSNSTNQDKIQVIIPTPIQKRQGKITKASSIVINFVIGLNQQRIHRRINFKKPILDVLL